MQTQRETLSVRTKVSMSGNIRQPFYIQTDLCTTFMYVVRLDKSFTSFLLLVCVILAAE